MLPFHNVLPTFAVCKIKSSPPMFPPCFFCITSRFYRPCPISNSRLGLPLPFPFILEHSFLSLALSSFAPAPANLPLSLLDFLNSHLADVQSLPPATVICY